jgi:hypothetical protein
VLFTLKKLPCRIQVFIPIRTEATQLKDNRGRLRYNGFFNIGGHRENLNELYNFRRNLELPHRSASCCSASGM